MSLLDDASLVVVPSGYKAGTVYSVKPTNGDGDLSFIRSNDTATRVNSAGLIEKVRTNLVTYSEDYSQSEWTNASYTKDASITYNSASVAPDGTLGVYQYECTVSGTNSQLGALKAISSGVAYSNSVYLRRITGSGIVKLRGVNNGEIDVTSELTSSWKRFEITQTSNSTNGRFYINALVSGDVIEVWGAQLEVSDFGATDYIPTTTTAVSVGMLANVPRLDYSGGGCPKLLLESQRTNALTYSEQFNNAAWTPTGVSVTANNAISPSGYQDADTVTFGASASQNIYNFPTSAIGANTFSIYAKTASGTKAFRLRIDTGSGPAVSSDFTATTTWQRFTFTATTTAAFLVAYIFNDSLGTAGDIQLWGAQLEAGSYATSYIPTLGSTVTRLADASYKASVSGLIGQTEGVLYAEVQNNSIGSTSGSDNVVLSIEGATNNDVVSILYQPLGDITALVFVGGSPQALITYNVGLTTSPKKIAVAYKNNDYALYVDGALRGTDTSASVPTCSNIGLGNYYNGGGITVINSKIVSQALLFKTRLSNAQLAELTTL